MPVNLLAAHTRSLRGMRPIALVSPAPRFPELAARWALLFVALNVHTFPTRGSSPGNAAARFYKDEVT
ncbi:MAG: hypothetical protein KDJ17_00600 [Hyphomicrobiaceae bacterium]|nr:hypothetical protein [Hyphomicrobiaceae bacterium]